MHGTPEDAENVLNLIATIRIKEKIPLPALQEGGSWCIIKQ